MSRLVRRSAYLRALVGGETAGEDRIEDRSAARRQLFDDVTEVIVAAASAAPLLIALDDLHAAEASSLLLLAHLAPALQSCPALVLGTARDSELAWQGRIEPRAAVVRRALSLPLRPLQEAEVASLVTRCVAARPAPR